MASRPLGVAVLGPLLNDNGSLRILSSALSGGWFSFEKAALLLSPWARANKWAPGDRQRTCSVGRGTAGPNSPSLVSRRHRQTSRGLAMAAVPTMLIVFLPDPLAQSKPA